MKKQPPPTPKQEQENQAPAVVYKSALAVTQGMASAFDKFADMLFLEDKSGDNNDKPPPLDMSAISASVDDSMESPPPPISFKDRVGSGSSLSVATPIRTATSLDSSHMDSSFVSSNAAVSLSNSSFAESHHGPFDEPDETLFVRSRSGGSSPEIVRVPRTTPMGRMRSPTIAQVVTMESSSFVRTPPRKSGEEAIASRHRKWRRTIKQENRRREHELRREREDQERKRLQAAPCQATADAFLGKNEPSQIFKALVRNSALQCGAIEDTTSVVYFSDETPSSEESSMGSHSVSPPRPLVRTAAYEASPLRRINEQQYEEDLAEVAPTQASSPSPPSVTTLDLQDKNFVKIFIRDVSKEGFPMIWHVPSVDGRKVDNPLEILAFLEMGCLLADGSFAGPRLAWYDPHGKSLGAIDLLDIRSLQKATEAQLNIFPYATAANCMILRLHNSFEDLVLEAAGPEVAKIFIHGLRWVVARLAFNLIIGNRDVSCELLDVYDSKPNSPYSERSKAMNDATNQLVEKSLFTNKEKLV